MEEGSEWSTHWDRVSHSRGGGHGDSGHGSRVLGEQTGDCVYVCMEGAGEYVGGEGIDWASHQFNDQLHPGICLFACMHLMTFCMHGSHQFACMHYMINCMQGSHQFPIIIQGDGTGTTVLPAMNIFNVSHMYLLDFSMRGGAEGGNVFHCELCRYEFHQ